jgi:hypothetical protein
MNRAVAFCLGFFIAVASCGQTIETVYLDKKDSTVNMYIAVLPQNITVNSFMFLLDGFGAAPQNVLVETDLPRYAARQGILTIIPLLKTGALYFGSDSASQRSLKEMIEIVAGKYNLHGKPLYLGGFSIGGTCVVRYAELAVQHNYAVKPKAIFGVDPPLDWERFYNAAERVVRLSAPGRVNGEVVYMIDRIKKEMGGTPRTVQANFYKNSPYSFSDTAQSQIKALVKTPVMLISEPDIQWWLSQRGYDYSYINITDHVAMINELQKMGNNQAVLITTVDKGYRKPNNFRHPHSWSIADPEQTVKWLLSQK